MSTASGDLICDAMSKSTESGIHTLLTQGALTFRPPKIPLLSYGNETNYTT